MKINKKNIISIKSIINEQKITNFKKKSPIFENRFWLISLYFIKLQIIKCSQIGKNKTFWDKIPTKLGNIPKKNVYLGKNDKIIK